MSSPSNGKTKHRWWRCMVAEGGGGGKPSTWSLFLELELEMEPVDPWFWDLELELELVTSIPKFLELELELVGTSRNWLELELVLGTHRVPDPKFSDLEPEPVRPDPKFSDMKPDPVRPVLIPESPWYGDGMHFKVKKCRDIRSSKPPVPKNKLNLVNSLVAAALHRHVPEGPVEAPTSSNSVVANPATDSAVDNTATDASSVST
ncbi:hypothetical protein LXL04_014559 [Taraxacum kok-saghyz]